MLNLFTYISAYPEKLAQCENPTFFADEMLISYSKLCEKVIFAWGNFKAASNRSKEVIKMFPNAYALLINKDGSPRHPLYVKGTTQLVKFNQETNQ